MEKITSCEFSEPVNIGQEIEDFEFSKVVCSTTDHTFELIEQGGKSFYIFKVWDYGTLFIAFLLLIVILWKITGSILNFYFGNFVFTEKKK